MQPLTSLRIRARRALGHRLDSLAWKVLSGSERVPMGFPPGHFSSTIPSRRDIDERSRTEIVVIDLRVDEQVALLAELDVGQPAGPRFRPYSWTDAHNMAFPDTDAAVYQAMLRHFRPARVIEVGCGWSAAALFDAGGARHVTLIEPYPQLVRQLLTRKDLDRCALLEARLQDVSLATFQALDAGDVLFVDSTHVTKLGSDVNRLVFEILPALANGVIVHFRDVAYPFEYPDVWVQQGRAWNEAYLLRAFLEYDQAFEILLCVDLLQATGHLAGDGLSIWLRKVGAPSSQSTP